MEDIVLEDRIKLVVSVWEALAEVFPEIFEDPRAKDWSLQKAIGVNTIHKLTPYIYGNMEKKGHTRNEKLKFRPILYRTLMLNISAK